MRAVLQRVLNASVTINNVQVSSINRGLCVLLGIATDDTEDDLEYIIKKILNVRIFEDETGKKMWARNVKDMGLEILCVSQFTLYGDVTKGNKPDFHCSMKAEFSKEMYTNFINRMKQEYFEDRIKDGVFGAMMNVSLVNEGPVTLELDSRKFIYAEKKVSSSKSKNKDIKEIITSNKTV
ncbi:D-tyrosyl-tRNA deacylase [Gigaspora rosea]|uniref:D-aminoacyl-tRNA deacylase n=1 Tax=Gigaspora rosea TaxID=44941 RepID=A0A397TZ61_9GLOM|nr:D-tyrosyl-tRNA deacylase [Gigaspora rosea]